MQYGSEISTNAFRRGEMAVSVKYFQRTLRARTVSVSAHLAPRHASKTIPVSSSSLGNLMIYFKVQEN